MDKNDFNPYVGLRPFNTNESLLFFGREMQTLELLQRLQKNKFVAVVGSSGSGKSSLIRAGLIPSLLSGYLVANSSKWMIAIMKPGKNPLYYFAESILKQIDKEVTDDDISSLLKDIEGRGTDAIIDIITPLRTNDKFNFFLLVDQFEEIFRFAMDQNIPESIDEAIDFVNIMLELSSQNKIPFYVVSTMRSDFIGDCAQFIGLPEAMNNSLYLVPKLNREQLRSVIEGPAKLYGYKIKSSLTSRLINHLGNVQDELPVLQHVLMRMLDFEKNQDQNGELDLDDYKSVGGFKRGLSKHADEAMIDMSEEEKEITATIFKALTTVDDTKRKIRRPASLNKLIALSGTSKDKVEEIIDKFIEGNRSFLIKVKMGDADYNIDISHESLIRQWEKLNNWVDDEEKKARRYLRLSEALNQHELNERGLLTDVECELAQKWIKNAGPTKNWADQYNSDFKDVMRFVRDSKIVYENKKKTTKRNKLLKKMAIYAVIIAPIGYLILNSYITIENKKEALKAQELALWSNVVTTKNLDDYRNFLITYPNGEYSESAEDSIKTKYTESYERARRLGVNDELREYLRYVSDSVKEVDGEIIEYHYSVFADSSRIKKVEDILNKVIEEEEENNPWKLAERGNTIKDYIAYIKGDAELGKYEEALVNINKVGNTGYLFSGRKNKDGSGITERVFNIVYRYEGGVLKQDAIPMKGDIIHLRGKSHRNIYNSQYQARKVGVVKNGMEYVVDSVITQGSGAIFLKIVY